MAPQPAQIPAATTPQGFPPNAPLLAPNLRSPDLPHEHGAGDAPAVVGIQAGVAGDGTPAFSAQQPVAVGVGAESTDVVEEDNRFI
jgi:hypothetical protein